MNTWGPSKKPRAQSSNRSGGSSRSAPKSTASSKSSPKSSSSSKSSSSRSGTTRDLTPPSTRRRDNTPTESRSVVSGREHDLTGVVLIGTGAVLALAMYFDLGGPLGSALDTFVGWFFGLARYLLPIALVSIGVSFIRKGRSSSPLRLVLGWGLVAAALLGLLHVVRNPDSFTDMDGLGQAGGWFGAVLVEPIATLIAKPGAVVVMLALAVGGALLITQTSLRTMATRTGRGVGAVAKPLGQYTKRALSDLSTLSSEREGGPRKKKPKRDNWIESGNTGIAGEPLSPSLYDGAEDDDELYGGSAASEAASAPKRRRATKPGAEQGALPIEGKQLGEWVLPPLAFLKQAGQQAVNMAEIEKRGLTLQESLASHGVDTQLAGMTVGPTVTRYELELGPGVKVARVTSLQRDIAYAMAAVDVRILAPIPGRSAIGVEVPNHKRQLVALGDLMVSKEANDATHPLEVAIGKDIAGRPVFLDISTTPHLLIAGATGAGKSSAINCIISSLLMRSTPDQVRLILIDPKQVEMGQYNRLPHLLTQPVTNPRKAANALGWAVKEMERRYDLLFEVGFRDIGGYNAAFDRGELAAGADERSTDRSYERLPFIVVVVDELNDLMMVAARDVEESI